MNKYVDGNGKVIKASEKAFDILYKHRGFRPYVDEPLIQPSDKPTDEIIDVDDLIDDEEVKEPTGEDLEATEVVSEIKPIEDYTKATLSSELKARGIKHNPGDRKDILYSLLVAGE